MLVSTWMSLIISILKCNSGCCNKISNQPFIFLSRLLYLLWLCCLTNKRFKQLECLEAATCKLAIFQKHLKCTSGRCDKMDPTWIWMSVSPALFQNLYISKYHISQVYCCQEEVKFAFIERWKNKKRNKNDHTYDMHFGSSKR